MYFLAKNIRTCSKSFSGTPRKVQLFKEDGVLNWEYLARNISYFTSHPEQIKQQLKEKDAHMLCQFFDSEEYKKKVSQFLETQGKILAKDSMVGGIKPTGAVKYQHVLSCAQPAHKKPRSYVEEIEAETNSDGFVAKRRRVKRGTIFDEIIKRKGGLDANPDPDTASVDTKPKKYRQRSTIMPIFLKKIKHRRLVEEHDYDEKESQDLPDYQTARRIKSLSDEEAEPLFAQILHKTNAYRKKPVQKYPSNSNFRFTNLASKINEKSRPKYQERPSTTSKLETKSPKMTYRLTEKVLNVPLTMGGVNPASNPKTDPMRNVPYKLALRRNTLELVEIPATNEKSNNKPSNKPKVDNSTYKLHMTSFKREDAPFKMGGNSGVIPLRMASSTAKVATKPPTITLYPRKNMNLKSFSEFLSTEIVPSKKKRVKSARDVDDRSVKIEVLPKEKSRKKGANTKKKGASMSMLMEQAGESKSPKSLKFENNLERKVTMMHVMRNKQTRTQKKKKNELELTSLFKKVKLGSSKNATSGTIITDEINGQHIEKAILKPIMLQTTNETQPGHHADHESFTYKIVSKNRERREAQLKKKFEMNPPYWQGKFNFSFAERGKQATNDPEELEDISVITSTPLKIIPSTFENCPIRQNVIASDIFRSLNGNVAFERYLIRLPKTTPEGYRVLLYSVRDPDPTKMNFNDVVKGFCMYNDCVLSEDGLQEGYIVIFDMRDVSIGHLARVSLPALKCFMYYIQDAHPCRLKQIHVLNTASWIQHVMRLIVPLVRSELLNLVKFHKGNVPEGLPVELLPMDYGGEAPTVEELDTSTKSLLDKYRDWLVESAHFKADESKRVKKGGWWGFFSKSPQQVELDEKTILKNLQID